MDANESIRFELLGESRDRFSKQVRAGLALEQNVVTFRLHHNQIVRIDKENSSVGLDRDVRGVFLRERASFGFILTELSRAITGCPSGGELQGLVYPLSRKRLQDVVNGMSL